MFKVTVGLLGALFVASWAIPSLGYELEKPISDKGACLYDGRSFSEGAIVAVKAEGFFIIQCQRNQQVSSKEQAALTWKQLGYVGNAKQSPDSQIGPFDTMRNR